MDWKLELVAVPVADQDVAKAFAWTILLRSHGAVNDALLWLHITDKPIRMIFTQTSLIVGAANIFLPFMILPIYAVVAQIDPRLSEAAAGSAASRASVGTTAECRHFRSCGAGTALLLRRPGPVSRPSREDV